MLQADDEQHEDTFCTKKYFRNTLRPQLTILSNPNVDRFFRVKLTRNCFSWFN